MSEVKAPERLRVRISDTGEPMGLAGPAATDGEASSVVEYVPATDSPDRERWLDRLIEVWHDEVLRDRAAEMELHEFLGVTWEEYAAWVEERADLHPPDRSDGLREALETLSDAVSEARWGTNLLSDQQTITISRIHFDRINAALAAARLALKAESK